VSDPQNERSARDDSAIRNYPRLLKRYARLVELTTDMVSTLDLDTLLQRIVDAAQEMTESEASSLLLYDPMTNHLYFEAATGMQGESFSRTPVPVDNSIAGWIFKNREPLLIHDAQADPRFFTEVDVQSHFSTQTLLGAPLVTNDKTLGVIEAVNKREGSFDDEDLRMLQSLAAQAAIGIQNTRLFQQSDLIAEMVHELRTPLSSLMAASNLLQRPDLAQAQSQKLCRTVYREVQRLNEMTSDFLELSRLESGRAQFTHEPVHIEGLILECLELIRSQAETNRIKLETRIDHDLSPVQGDRNRLKQLLLNLLTNAIKYNKPDGYIRVHLTHENKELVLAVEDSGLGIPAENLPAIFNRFYRVPDHAEKTTGTGLGLVIAQRIAHSHQGYIEVESEEGVGSTFTLRLPASRR
jgi:signal transduction histidine kinase